MSTSWVAGTVRAKALARRRAGGRTARRLAGTSGLDAALTTLVATPYGHDVRAGQTLAEAEHGVGGTLLWHLRVLSGWVPHDGVEMLRVLAAGFEVANTDAHLRRLRDAGPDTPQSPPQPPPYRLGTLSTAWPRIDEGRTAADVAAALTGSPWGAPGGTSEWDVQVGMRLSWATRVVRVAPAARAWARAAVALLVVRETALSGNRLSPLMARRVAPLLGRRFSERCAATSPPDPRLDELARMLPAEVRWALDGVEGPADLWRAEAAWWRRVESDGLDMLRGSDFGPRVLLGAVAVLAADAWRVRAALESAARGGHALEDFDAVA